jgi:hypothetical protein
MKIYTFSEMTFSPWTKLVATGAISLAYLKDTKYVLCEPET